MEKQKREVNLNEEEVIDADAIPEGEAPETDEEVIPPVDESELEAKPTAVEPKEPDMPPVAPPESSPDEVPVPEAEIEVIEPS